MSSRPSKESFGVQEDEVKRAADIREWLEGRINELETETSKLREMLLVVDSVLRRSSFIPAAELRTSTQTTPAKTRKPEQVPKETKVARVQTSPSSGHQEVLEQTRPLRRTKDGLLIANAYVTPEKVVIVPTSEVKLGVNTPPFNSFFINRILKGFETKDREMTQTGALQEGQVMQYKVEESEGNISKVTVTNYRDRARLNEILSTVNWAFTRMLEKK